MASKDLKELQAEVARLNILCDENDIETTIKEVTKLELIENRETHAIKEITAMIRRCNEYTGRDLSAQMDKGGAVQSSIAVLSVKVNVVNKRGHTLKTFMRDVGAMLAAEYEFSTVDEFMQWARCYVHQGFER